MTHIPPGPLLSLLRDATRTAHECMHRNPLLMQMLSEAATRADLCNVLHRFLDFYGVLEPRLARVNLPRFDFEATPLAWLARDLQRLGATEADAGSAGKAKAAGGQHWAHSAPAIDNLEGYLAYLYVKQGSGLGGQLIARRLHANGVLAPGESSEFFTGFGSATGRHWQSFQRFLESFADRVDPGALQAHGAAHFAYLQACFAAPINARLAAGN